MKATRYLSTADASRVLGVTPATVRLMARRGDLPVSAMTEGGIHLFRRADVDALARRRAERKRPRGGDCEEGTFNVREAT
jgi:excisionase family DNA binding protein